MARTERVFVSDIHLGAQREYDSGVAWYAGGSAAAPGPHRRRFLGFLDRHVIQRADKIKDFIILGDLFDNWVCRAQDEPPSWDELFDANKPEIEAFNEIAKRGIRLFFIHGNHDFDLREAELKSVVPKVKVVKAYKGAGRAHAEHGHHHTLFNKPDFLNDPGFGRPIGYFVSRLFSSSPGSGRSFPDILSYLDDVVEAIFTSETLFGSIIEALAERADVDKVTMPGNKEMTVEEVKERYKNLAQQHKLGLWQLKTRILKEGNLGDNADEQCKTWGFNLVLYGHTHNAKIDKDSIFVEDRIYANTGTWCRDDAHCVIVEKFPIKDGVRVTLAEVDASGKIIRRRVKSLD